MSLKISSHEALYRAQAASSCVHQVNFLPCYAKNYIESQSSRFKKIALTGYSKAYDALDSCCRGIQTLFEKRAQISPIPQGFLDVVAPINPITGKRHVVIINRFIEKGLGDYIWSFIHTLYVSETYETLANSNERIADRVNSVAKRVIDSNQDLLNPPSASTRFDYRVTTEMNSSIGAFSMPGGHVVVASQLVKELEAALRSKAIQETVVQFADGSRAIINLEAVTMDDVLASLLGHEIAHAASRDVITTLVQSFLCYIAICLLRFAYSFYSGSGVLSSLATLEELPAELFDDMPSLFSDPITGTAEWLFANYLSRQYEYKADVSGAYLAKEAGFNSLGALYLQEFFSKSQTPIVRFFETYLDPLFTHPCAEHRKRAIFAAIQRLDQEKITALTQWELANSIYDLERSGKGFAYAHNLNKKTCDL